MSTQTTTESFAEIGIPTNPFPGLRPFEFDESHLFFGRDGQSEQLIGKLSRTHFLAVVGTSGSGKSSLVRAGFLPALHGGFMTSAGSRWRVAIMRPGNDPIGNLARALNAPDVFGSEIEENAALQTAMAEATLRRGSLGLVDAIRQAVMPEDENLLVVVDQFEEIFRFARVAEGEAYGNEAAGFIKLLLEAARQREIPIYVVLTMRSDYLGDCSQFWELPEAINESQYLIPRLTRDQLREAITGPVAVGGGQITPRLVNRLLNDVGDNQDQLPVLQHLLMRVWDESKEKRLTVEVKAGDSTITRPHQEVHEGDAMDLCCSEAVGGMSQALSRHADEAFNELPDEHHKVVAEKLFKALTEKGSDNREIRRPITLAQICAVTGAIQSAAVTVVETFRQPGRSFLMPPANVGLDPESLIDISHESLIRGWTRLKDWVNEEARSARIYRRVADTAVLYKEGGAGLWRDPDLQIALTWREQSNPNPVWARRYHPEFALAMNFLDESVAARDAQVAGEEARRRKEIKRTRLTAAILGVAFLASLGMGGYAVSAKKYAEQQAEVARLSLKEAETQKANALVQKDAAEKAKTEALGLKTLAETARGEALDQKKNAEHQAEIAKNNLKEADTQRHIAEQASERVKAEALKGQALSALKEGKPDDAIKYFIDLNKLYRDMKNPPGQAYALASIADVHKDRVPLALIGSEYGPETDDPSEGDQYLQMIRQYQILARFQDLGEKAVLEEVSRDADQAVDYYNQALAADKQENREQLAKTGDVFKSLGDLQIGVGALKAELLSGATEKNASDQLLEDQVEPSIKYYTRALEAYAKASMPLEEAGVLNGIAMVRWKALKRKTTARANTQAGTQQNDTGNLAVGLEKIVTLFNLAANAFQQSGKPLQEAAVFVRIGDVYDSLPKDDPEGRRNKIRYLEQALEIYRTEKNFRKEATLSEKLAGLHGELSDTNREIALYKEAFETYRGLESKQAADISKASEMLNKVGALLFDSKGKEAAHSFFEEALNSSGNDPASKAQTLSNIGDFYKNLKRDSAEAVKYYARKREVWSQAGNFIEAGNALVEIGSIQIESQDAKGAIESLDAARKAFDQIDPRTMDATGKPVRFQLTGTLVRIAQMYLAQDKQKAIATYEEALQIEMLAKEPTYSFGQIFQSEGRILLEMKTSESATKARQFFQKVLEYQRSRKSPEGEGSTLASIGDLYRSSGEKTEARAYYEQAREAYSRGKSPYVQFELLIKMGQLEVETQGTSLPDYYKGQAESARRSHDLFWLGTALNVLAQYYRDKKERQLALDYFDQARQVYHDMGETAQEINLLRSMSYLYSDMGNKQKADEFSKKANDLSRPPK